MDDGLKKGVGYIETMAKVIAPLHSIQVRGKIGGTLFRRWRNLNTASEFKPGGGGSGPGGFVIIGNGATAWGGLTSAQRESWEGYSKKKKYKNKALEVWTLPGYNQYLRHYYLATMCGETPLSDPPETKWPDQPEGLTFGVNLSDKLEVGWSEGQEADYIQIKGAFNQKASRKIFSTRVTNLAFVETADESWEGSTAQTGKKSLVKVRLIRINGQYGPWLDITIDH